MRSNRHTFRVIYGDTDMMGVVYYANYLRYFEAGRNEFLRAVGIDYREMEAQGFILPVVEASAKYHLPARYDDELILETELKSLRFTSLRMYYRLFRQKDDALLTTGETKHACLSKEGRLVRFPSSFRAKLEAFGADER